MIRVDALDEELAFETSQYFRSGSDQDNSNSENRLNNAALQTLDGENQVYAGVLVETAQIRLVFWPGFDPKTPSPAEACGLLATVVRAAWLIVPLSAHGVVELG